MQISICTIFLIQLHRSKRASTLEHSPAGLVPAVPCTSSETHMSHFASLKPNKNSSTFLTLSFFVYKIEGLEWLISKVTCSFICHMSRLAFWVKNRLKCTNWLIGFIIGILRTSLVSSLNGKFLENKNYIPLTTFLQPLVKYLSWNRYSIEIFY